MSEQTNRCPTDDGTPVGRARDSRQPQRRSRLLGDLSWSDQRVRDAVRLSARMTTAMVIPLIVAWPLGLVAEGMQVAVGSLFVSIADPGGRQRTRLLYLGVTAVGVTAAAFLATVAGSTTWLSMLVMAVLGFLAGYAVVLGPKAAVVGAMVLLKYVFTVMHAGSTELAFDAAALTAIGAVFALVVQLLLFPSHVRRRAERSLATLAHGVASYCRRVVHDPTDMVVTRREQQVLLDARSQAMGARGGEGVESPLFRLSQRLVEIHRAVATVAAMMTESPTVDWRPMQDQLLSLARDLDDFAELLGRARSADQTDRHRDADRTPEPDAAGARQVEAGAEPPCPDRVETTAARRPIPRGGWKELSEAREQLTLARADVAGPDEPASDEGPEDGHRSVLVPQDPKRPTGTLRPLLANLTMSSFAFRHALQLSIAAAASVALYAWVLPVLVPWWPLLAEQGYWIALTVIVVLKLDVAGIYRRVKQRTVGTAVGAIVALVIAVTIHDGIVLLLLTIPFCAAAFFFFPLRYGTFVVFLTPLVIVMMGILAPGDWQLALARVADTFLGAALGFLVAMTVLPNREQLRFPDEVHRLADTVADYLREVSGALRDGAASQELRRVTRVGPALLNAEESYERLLAEPFTRSADDGREGTILFHFRRLCQDCAVVAHLAATGRTRHVPEDAVAVLDAAADAVTEVGVAVADGRSAQVSDTTRRTLESAVARNESHGLTAISHQTLAIAAAAASPTGGLAEPSGPAEVPATSPAG